MFLLVFPHNFLFFFIFLHVFWHFLIIFFLYFFIFFVLPHGFLGKKFDAILATRRRDLRKRGLGFVDKGKDVMPSPMIFVKTSSSKEVGESSKPMLIKTFKKIVHKLISHY